MFHVSCRIEIIVLHLVGQWQLALHERRSSVIQNFCPDIVSEVSVYLNMDMEMGLKSGISNLECRRLALYSLVLYCKFCKLNNLHYEKKNPMYNIFLLLSTHFINCKCS